MWELNMLQVPGVFENLKTLNMSDSQDLTATPDFTKFPCLETLYLRYCKSLEDIHLSIGCLVRLVSLYLDGCVNLKSLPDTICNLRALKVLSIALCSNVKSLPTKFGDLESLAELNAFGLTVSKLPNSIQCLSKLVDLNLRGSKYLRTLPNTFCNLRALEVLDISDCTCLEALPPALGNIQSLRKLCAENLTVSKLQDSIGHLSKLVELRLGGNKNLEALPDTICNLRSLEILHISECEKLEVSPNQLCKITSLRELSAGGATVLNNFSHVESSQFQFSLQKLSLSKSVLTALPSGISQCSNLEDLNLKDCRGLLSIAELPRNLKWISADGCMSMEKLPNLSDLKQLEYLNLKDCSCLTEIQGLEGLTSIKRLYLEGCNSSILAYILTERFFQVYSEFGNPIQISLTEFPVWISLSSDQIWRPTTMSLDLPSNGSCHFLGMVLCFKSCLSTKYYVKNTTSEVIWRGSVESGIGEKSLMVIVPRSIFSVEDGDDRIKFATNGAKTCAIHLLYKTEEFDGTAVINIGTVEKS